MIIKRKITLIKILLFISILEGIFSLKWLLSIEVDPKNIWLFGYSLNRLLMSSGVILGLILLGYFCVRFFNISTLRIKTVQFFDRFGDNDLKYLAILSGMNLLIFAAFLLIGNFDLNNETYEFILSRLKPVPSWFILVLIQLEIIIVSFKYINYGPNLKLTKKIIKPALIFFCLSLLVIIFTLQTRVGLDPIGDWENLGIQVLIAQIMFACLLSLIITTLSKFFQQTKKFNTLIRFQDLLLVLLLWVSAIFLWQSVEVTSNYFFISPTAPNYEKYPYSDASIYDTIAQNYLVGEGFKPDDINEKPLYSFLLAGFHALVGQNYDALVNLQIVFLALIPVALFVLGKLFFNRFTGLLLAFIAILREYNAISLNNKFDISHSKLLMTDLPSMLMMVVFIALTVYWLIQKPKDKKLSFLAGSLLGLLVLVRTQNLILAGIVIFYLSIIFISQKKKLLELILIFVLGTTVIISPWVIRNYIKNGYAFAVMPSKGTAIPQRFHFTSGQTVSGFEGKSFNDGINILIEFTKENPAKMLEIVTAQFIHNEISTLLIIPSSLAFEDCCRLNSGEVFPYLLRDWDGYFESQSFIPILINLIMISIGVGASWHWKKIVGLLPLLIHMLFNLGSVIWGMTGWRFILPVDWIGILYYSIGLTFLLSWLFNYSFVVNTDILLLANENQERVELNPKLFNYLSALCIFIGLLLPLSELLIPQRYSEITKIEAINSIRESTAYQNSKDSTDFQMLKENENIIAYTGRALYPHFYKAGFGQPGSSNSWSFGEIINHNRLAFYLAGPKNANLTLLVDEVPLYFPNGVDVIILGCQLENGITAQIVYIINDPETIYFSTEQCP